jgi:hypothetical protein
MGGLIDEYFATFETNTTQDFYDFFDVLEKEDGFSEFDMSKVAGTVQVVLSVRGADERVF